MPTHICIPMIPFSLFDANNTNLQVYVTLWAQVKNIGRKRSVPICIAFVAGLQTLFTQQLT